MTTPRERDQALDQWLQRSGSSLAPSTDACLDAETAAAWADDALSGAALEQAQQHVADCARCQAVMASLTRMAFAAESTGSENARSFWHRWLTWGVPLATAAAAVVAIAVWVKVPRPDSQIARTEAPGAATTAAAPSAPEVAPPATQTPAPEVPPPTMRRSESGTAAPERRATEPGKDAAAAKKEQAPQQLADSAGGSASAPVAAPPEAAPDAARESAAKAAPAPRAFSAQAPTAAAAAAPAAQSVDRFATDSTFGTIEVPSPVPNVRWRVSGGIVEKTIDAGTTWAATPTGAPVSIQAGAAPSPLVCWLVGHAGAILLTTDGVRWSRPVFPEPADLVGIAATDARSAVVTTADGRRFRTADGGRSWTLQEN